MKANPFLSVPVKHRNITLKSLQRSSNKSKFHFYLLLTIKTTKLSTSGQVQICQPVSGIFKGFYTINRESPFNNHFAKEAEDAAHKWREKSGPPR